MIEPFVLLQQMLKYTLFIEKKKELEGSTLSVKP